MNRTLIPAGIAHDHPPLAKLSTLPASHRGSSRPCGPDPVLNGGHEMFLNCPACLDPERAVRCGLPAEVRCRFTMHSTDGPLESAMIRCPAGHYFSGPIELLTSDDTGTHDRGPAGPGSRAGHDSCQRGHDGRGGLALPDFPAEAEPKARRPTSAPAYYLGHPAGLWITAMRPRRERTASRDLMETAVSRG